MGLITEYVNIHLTGSLISYYEKLGYKIPRKKGLNYQIHVPNNTYIAVKVIDLPKSSSVKIEAECDCCKKHKFIPYVKYNKNVTRNNGFYLCLNNKQHKDFTNGLSPTTIIKTIKEFYNKNDRFPKYNEYTVENGFSFTYSIMNSTLKENGIILADELSKIDPFKSINVKYYNYYAEQLKKLAKEDLNIGFNFSRDEKYKNIGFPDARWFINHCPDKSVTSFESFKKWLGIPNKNLSKNECEKIILDMSKSYNRPLMYDDFRGHEIGQVTIPMINNYWGSLNKMKKELGLEINIESMIDKSLSKEDFDKTVLEICNFVKSDGRNFITTNEIDNNKDWSNAYTLQRIAKKYYNCKLQDRLSIYGISLGKQGSGISYTFNDGERVTSQFEYMFSKFLRNNGLQYNIDYFRDVKYSFFIKDYNHNMNCDYVIKYNNQTVYIEIAGIIDSYKEWYYSDRVITKSKSKEIYRQKLNKKEFMLKENNLKYFILFPCDLTLDNFENILNNPSLELKKKIEHFNQNNIDWVKIRNTTGVLDYSKPFLRNTYSKKKVG